MVEVTRVDGEVEDAGPQQRDDIILLDQELRELVWDASLTPDGRSLHGRKSKHNTTTRRLDDTVGLPALNMGKLPTGDDLVMLRMPNRGALSGADQGSHRVVAAARPWPAVKAADGG